MPFLSPYSPDRPGCSSGLYAPTWSLRLSPEVPCYSALPWDNPKDIGRQENVHPWDPGGGAGCAGRTKRVGLAGAWYIVGVP